MQEIQQNLRRPSTKQYHDQLHGVGTFEINYVLQVIKSSL